MDIWSKLERTKQFQIALGLARRKGASLKAESPNVISVGAGFRSRTGAALPTDEVCLRILVRRKWKSARAGRGSIPRYVRTRVRIGRKTVAVSIPTDVSEFRGGAPHVGINLTAGITSRRSGKPLDYGSACCMVRNATSQGERYLLTCYHVFSPSLRDTPGGLDCVSSSGGRLIGPMLEIADPESTGTALDAALALVEDSALDSASTWGRVPVSRATDNDISLLPQEPDLFVYGRRVAPAVGNLPEVTRPGPLPAAFQSLFSDSIPFDYQQTAGRTLYFADTIEYVADVRPGDSGAAVMNSAGKLFGMHFYGQGNTGYAFSAPRLFDPDVFPFDIVLT
jgi:hypothetical protein